MTSPEQNIIIAKSLGYNLMQNPENPFKFNLSLGNGFWYEINVKMDPNYWKVNKDDIMYNFTDEIVPIYGRETAGKFKSAYENATKDKSEVIKAHAPAEPKPESKDLTAKHEGKTKQKKKKNVTVKNNKEADSSNGLGMELPIVYPTELKGNFMRFRQWKVDNNVIPAKSEVIILDEDEYNFKVFIPLAHISFDIGKSKAEVIPPGQAGITC
jgi:hypothetical protein